MRQPDNEELLYGNTGRKRRLTLKKTQERSLKLLNRFFDLRKGSWELILT